MDSKNFNDEFNTKKNKSSWDILHSYIANILTVNHIPLDNVFFVNTPNFVVYFSEIDNAIFQRPAMDFSDFITRKVIIEKCPISIKFHSIYSRESQPQDKIISRAYNTMSYRLNWNESHYGDGYDIMSSIKTFFKSKSHLAVFLYVDDSFFETIQQTKIIRVATLDTTVF